jgi:polysaccharide biosynthesis protein PslH
MRNLTMIRAAAMRGPVDLITFGERDSASDAELRRLCRRVHRVSIQPRSIRTRTVSLLQSRLPDMAHRLWSEEFASAFQQWTTQHQYAVVQVEGIELARYVAKSPGSPRYRVVFDDHNVEYLLQERAFEFDRVRWRRAHAAAYSAVQANRLRAFERTVCESSDAVIAVSREDAERLRSIAQCSPEVIPNAIDVTAYPLRCEQPTGERTLLFPGTMDFRPNADAATWFIERVLPRVVCEIPDVQCFFAGRRPRADLVHRGQHDPRIAVTGEVPSMTPYWERATICILPLQVGGGSRFKALEAMAYGIPIVSTGLGMEGIDAAEGRDYLRADDAASFAEAVLHLLSDRSLRESLAAHARTTVKRGYTQDVVTKRLNALYDQICL